MAENTGFDKINILRTDITDFELSISNQIKKLEDELKLSEQENEELLENARILSRKIIETQEKKLKLYTSRHELLSGSKDKLHLLLAAAKICTQQKPQLKLKTLFECGVLNDNAESKDPTSILMPNQSFKTSSLSGQNPETSPIEVDGTSKVLSEAYKNNITRFFEDFKNNRKQILKKLTQCSPENWRGCCLKKKVQVEQLDGEEILIGAVWQGIVALATKAKLFLYCIEDDKRDLACLEETMCSLDIKTRKEIILGSESGNLLLFDSDSSEKEVIKVGSSAVTGVKFHPSGDFVVAISSGFWSLFHIYPHQLLLNQDTGSTICGFDLHPNGTYLATCSVQGSVTFWDIRTANLLGVVENIYGNIVKFSIQGNLVCINTETGIKLLDAKSHPNGTLDWNTNEPSSRLNMIQVDGAGKVLIYAIGNCIRVLVVKRDGKDNNSLQEILKLSTEAQVIQFGFLENGILCLLKSGEILLYNF